MRHGQTGTRARQMLGSMLLGALVVAGGSQVNAQALDQDFEIDPMLSSVELFDPSGASAGQTTLAGVVRTTVNLAVNLVSALGGTEQTGMVVTRGLVFAGTPVDIMGVSSGTICTQLAADNPGTIGVTVTTGALRINTMVTNLLEFTNPMVAGQIGDVMFDLNIVTGQDGLSLDDLLPALMGAPLILQLDVPVDSMITQGPLQGFRLMGNLRLNTLVGERQPNPLVDECEARQSS